MWQEKRLIVEIPKYFVLDTHTNKTLKPKQFHRKVNS